jgi:Reverse transcriptase (RNA-dependent DNA polymerase)
VPDIPPSVQRIIESGTLPENLPPLFTSARIWPLYTGHSGSYLVTTQCIGAISQYNASKRGGQRRFFGLPHPTFVFDQAVFFEKHWAALKPLLASAKGSASIPHFLASGPRAMRITPHSDLPKARLKSFSRFKFCAISDVARFYPSIYTHSIPWAINGRVASKADTRATSATVFGNKLDFVVRQAQDRQTIGLPVGPDTSKIASELILCAVDKQFLKGRRSLVYLRHVDDYWIGGNTIDECERHLQNLRSALREYELDLNELKTKILPAHYVFGESWPTEVERELQQSLQPFMSLLNPDPVSTLGKIVERARNAEDDGIIRHAIRTIDEHNWWTSNWDVLEHFLAQCAIQFPHSFDYVARVVVWRIRTDKAYNKSLWTEVARLVALRSGALSRDSEVVWALWLLKELRQKLTTRIADQLISYSNPLTFGIVSSYVC